MSDSKTWAESLRAGDEVAISDAYGQGFTIAKVTRTTATQVVVPGYNGTMRRFRRDEWAREIGVGSAYHYSRLQPLTDEVRAAIERAELVQWLIWLTTTSAGSRAMTLPVLRAMRAAHDAGELNAIGWITYESVYRLKRGGNDSRGTVPIHVERSSVAKMPVYVGKVKP